MHSYHSLPLALAVLSFKSACALYTNGSVIAPCSSPLYCQGEILRQIELAQPYEDSKTFVDLPTTRPLEEVIEAFNNLTKPISNNTELQTFLEDYFGEAGSELEPVPNDSLSTDPTFLSNVSSQVLRNFTDQVINIWPDLTRSYVGPPRCESASGGNASGCVSSFIPLNRTFVVAGGRFREPYYWDSYWIIEGLLRTEGSFTEIALNIIENFLDLVDRFGFVPNGARQYYLNRSQPPLLSQMVRAYVEYTNDTSILERALPTLEKEYMFWMENRTVSVRDEMNQTYTLNHYAVLNNQPRPESFREDYVTANNESYYAPTTGIIYPGQDLNETEREELYANLASGAESGWDYSSRWLKNPSDAANDNYFPLRSLNTKNIVPVDLNSILYANEITLANFYETVGGDDSEAMVEEYQQRAANRSEAMAALMWDEEQFAYFDWNLTSNSRHIYEPLDSDATTSQIDDAPKGQQVLFSPAQYYPFWTGAAPTWLKNNPYAVSRAYDRVAAQLEVAPGAIPATNLVTGEQASLTHLPPSERTTRHTNRSKTSLSTWLSATSRLHSARGEAREDRPLNCPSSREQIRKMSARFSKSTIRVQSTRPVAVANMRELKTPMCGNITAADIADE
ncbi:hypothetical protein KC349_g117 [Hortaea werneckii]|nr:hypothetical protein KC349_g117 [Hortaea werneckii]